MSFYRSYYLLSIAAVRREIDASGVEEFVPICDDSSLNALRICNLSSLRPENFLHSLLRKHKFQGMLINDCGLISECLQVSVMKRTDNTVF